MQKKKQLLQQLNANCNFRETVYYKILEQLGDLITNCGDYMITEPINCDEELKSFPEADYELCAVLLTMLLREVHLCGGSFGSGCETGRVQQIADRMIVLL